MKKLFLSIALFLTSFLSVAKTKAESYEGQNDEQEVLADSIDQYHGEESTDGEMIFSILTEREILDHVEILENSICPPIPR